VSEAHTLSVLSSVTVVVLVLSVLICFLSDYCRLFHFVCITSWSLVILLFACSRCIVVVYGLCCMEYVSVYHPSVTVSDCVSTF